MSWDKVGPGLLDALVGVVRWYGVREGRDDGFASLSQQPPEIQKAMLAIDAAAGLAVEPCHEDYAFIGENR